MSTRGGHGYGVFVRTRSTILRPSASRTDAFRPVPPMSIASVVGVDRASSGTGIIVVSSVPAIATSLQTCSMDRIAHAASTCSHALTSTHLSWIRRRTVASRGADRGTPRRPRTTTSFVWARRAEIPARHCGRGPVSPSLGANDNLPPRACCSRLAGVQLYAVATIGESNRFSLLSRSASRKVRSNKLFD